MSGEYGAIPGTGAPAYESVDPSGYTKQAADSIYGAPAQNLMNQGMQGFSAWNAAGNDPNSFMNQFLNDFGGLTGAITEATSPLSQQLKSQVTDMTREATQQVGSQMAGLGGLRSSGMGNLAGQEAGRIAGRAATDLGTAQLGLLNSLGGNAMSQRGSALQTMMRQPMDVMNLQGQFGAPTYAAPQVAMQPGPLDWITSLLGGAGSAVGGIGSLFGG